jgi:3-dehydroquinate synthase
MISREISSQQYKFSGKDVDVYFDVHFEELDNILSAEHKIFITDENIYAGHQGKFRNREVIVIPAGERFKNQSTVNKVIDELILRNADRRTFIIGVGGGVVTDVTGFVASIYMRGIRFGFVPTSVLAMVDASIGGKNGIDVGVYKNLVGVINQPEFLLYDFSYLETLPDAEWVNGFAEVIKHACIRDRDMFRSLSDNSLAGFKLSGKKMSDMVRRNASIKYGIVSRDEKESGERRLLNFGHTIGHAIENSSGLSHGHAISIGMVLACQISESINNFDPSETKMVSDLLQQYLLPVAFAYDKEKTWDILLHDKKKAGDRLSFVVLDSIGKGSVQLIPIEQLHKIFNSL